MADETNERGKRGWRGRVRRALWWGVGLEGFLVLVEGVCRPVHERGWGQGWLSIVDGVGAGLRVAPGFVMGHAGLPDDMPPVVFWPVKVAFGVVVLAVVAWVVMMVWRLGAGPRGPGGEAGPLVSRRKFIAGAAAVGVAGTGSYSLAVAPLAFRVRRYAFEIEGLPGELEGLVVAQLSDIHHGPFLPLSHVRRIVAEANALRADLIVLTGDYILESQEYAEPVVGELAKLRAKIGVVGVLGNHDWHGGAERIQRAFARVGIPLIDNSRVVVTAERKLAAEAERGLAVCGVGDLWFDQQLYGRALGDLPLTMPRVLLSHNPDVAEEAEFVGSGFRVDLMLCGHLHGGQVWVPGVGAPWCPSAYGTKYAWGLVQGPTTRVFTTPGLGTAGVPVRFNATPEISVVELRGKGNA